MPVSYVELHAKSAFSFLRGASIPEEYADRTKDLNQAGMALIDCDGVYGAPRFHLAMLKLEGPRAFIGSEVLCADGARYPLLVQNRKGYQNLCRLITRAKLRTAKHPKPGKEAAVTHDELAEFSEGLLCLSGDENGPLTRGLYEGQGKEAIEK